MDFLLDPTLWVAFAMLTTLEIVLGIDNIIFLTILVGRLPAGSATPRAARAWRSRWSRASRCCCRSAGSWA